MSRLFAPILAGVILFCSTIPSQAAVIVYQNQAAFAAATTNTTTINFNGIAAPGGFVSFANGPLSQSGVSVTSTGILFVIDPGFYGFPYTQGGILSSDFADPNIITATLPAGQNAFGFNYGALFAGGPSTALVITLSTGEVVNVAANGSFQTNNLGFVGITSSAPISSFTVQAPDAPFFNAFDNFVFGQSTPEPATFTVFGVLAVAAFGVRRRLKSTKATA